MKTLIIYFLIYLMCHVSSVAKKGDGKHTHTQRAPPFSLQARQHLVLALSPALSAPMAAASQWELPPTVTNGCQQCLVKSTSQPLFSPTPPSLSHAGSKQGAFFSQGAVAHLHSSLRRRLSSRLPWLPPSRAPPVCKLAGSHLPQVLVHGSHVPSVQKMQSSSTPLYSHPWRPKSPAGASKAAPPASSPPTPTPCASGGRQSSSSHGRLPGVPRQQQRVIKSRRPLHLPWRPHHLFFFPQASMATSTLAASAPSSSRCFSSPWSSLPVLSPSSTQHPRAAALPSLPWRLIPAAHRPGKPQRRPP
jgi:hypothetical protein